MYNAYEMYFNHSHHYCINPAILIFNLQLVWLTIGSLFWRLWYRNVWNKKTVTGSNHPMLTLYFLQDVDTYYLHSVTLFCNKFFISSIVPIVGQFLFYQLWVTSKLVVFQICYFLLFLNGGVIRHFNEHVYSCRLTFNVELWKLLSWLVFGCIYQSQVFWLPRTIVK